jgi:hypothetical protein
MGILLWVKIDWSEPMNKEYHRFVFFQRLTQVHLSARVEGD